MSVNNCPCCSNKTFSKCCGPYLRGDATPKTVKQLMRSRYSAFALGGHGEYLLTTWHPGTAPNTEAATLSLRELDWQQLEILNFAQHSDHGTVEFIAHFRDANGKLGSHHEISRFQRVAGKWLYVDAQR